MGEKAKPACLLHGANTEILPGAAGTAILLHRITIKYLISDHAKGNSKRQIRKHKMLITLFLKSIHMIILSLCSFLLTF